VLHSLADMLRRTLDQRISIEIDLSERAMTVLADPGQLESALLNIAINARDAMQGGGTLRFSVEICAAIPETIVAELGEGARPDDFVAISIADSGAGMTAEARERAFEPFFTTKEPGRGTGLGLSTVYGFIKQSKGAVTLDSVLGRGTRVTLYLPRPTGSGISPPGEAVAGSSVPVGLTVLLVEDDAEVRMVMRRFLDSFACRVSEAASGEQALLVLDANPGFDLLLTDIALGAGMRGTDLAAQAHARAPAMAIVLMSGYSAELLDADRDSPQAWELLRKPCSREELAQAITRVVGRP
jgi:CheY-like chemotaxis protein